MRTVDLSIPSSPRRTCTVRIGVGARRALVDDLARNPPGRRLYIVSDANVARMHGASLRDLLRDRELDAELISFPAGEENKTRETKARIEDRLLELGADRQSALIALGGGVTGDLAGFVASTWFRGIPVVQAPTSLLAMVDASIGGKTAVNLPSGKNLVGSVHQPWGVYADLEYLATLPQPDYLDGFAEVVKSGVIADASLFRWLESAVEALERRDRSALEHAIERSVTIKARVVKRDERETGRRAVLNFGHTVGHAIEAASGYAVRHGRAVAVGMCAECRLATRSTGFPPSGIRRLEELLRRLELPTQPPPDLPTSKIVQAARLDKKSRDGKIYCALPVRVGRMPARNVSVPVREIDLSRAIERLRNDAPD